MTRILKQIHPSEHVVELLMNDPIVWNYCKSIANLKLQRSCRDSEEYCDLDWWNAHNNALFELLSDAASSIERSM